MPGSAWKVGNDINTDAIIPGRFLADWNKNPEKLKNYCFLDFWPEFTQGVQPGDYVVAGTNFGCGSSREGAPVAIKMTGVKIIIAKSFARIFYRNCINIGLLALESPDAANKIETGDQLEVDTASGVIRNITKNQTYTFAPIPPFLKEILNIGGLAAHVKKRLNIE